MPRLKIILQSKLFLIISLIFIFSYVFLITKVIKWESKYDEATTSLIGTILDYKIEDTKITITLKGKEKVKVTYYSNSEDEINYLKDNLKLGLKLKLEGKMQIPSNNTIPNTFNYKKYLYNQQIYFIFKAKSLTILNNKINIFYQIKNSLIKRALSFKKTKAYMETFILGNKDDLADDIYEIYKDNGVTHLFAISGMHLSFMLYFLTLFLNKLKIKEAKRNIFLIVFLIFYMFIVGFTASIMRASLFFIFLLINKKLELPSWLVLYLVFIFLLLINPFYIYDLGFLYSFITTLGLILFSSKIKGNYFKKTFLVSFIAFIFSLPITIFNFYEFNLLTIFNNILIVPLISLIVFPLTIITFILPFLENILVIFLKLLENINLFCWNFKINIIVPKINVLFIIIYYFIIYLIYKKGYKYTIYLVLLIFSMKLLVKFNNNYYLYYLDVGQGDSTLIVSKNQKDVILIDTGGKVSFANTEFKDAKNNLIDNTITLLKSLGLNRIDYLITTHGDFDHLGEGINLVNSFKVKKVIFNKGEINNLEADLINLLKVKKIKYLNNLAKLKLNNLTLNFLDTSLFNNENDNSNIIYFKIKDYNFLFMGDAGLNAEADILNNYNLPSIDVLKVGHHGSNTSSSAKFINEITPKYAIISVGKNNLYGHPHAEVLSRLKNSKIYRTDIKGTIRFKIGNDLKVTNYPP